VSSAGLREHSFISPRKRQTSFLTLCNTPTRAIGSPLLAPSKRRSPWLTLALNLPRSREPLYNQQGHPPFKDKQILSRPFENGQTGKKFIGLKQERAKPWWDDIHELSSCISSVEEDGKGGPILLKQYLKLGGRFLCFNLDHEFGKASIR